MTAALIGVDIGATKTALRAELPSREVVDRVVPSIGWDAEPVADGAAWIDRVVRGAFALSAESTILAVGAQGLDSVELAAELRAKLVGLGYAAVACVNDAALLVPAAGCEHGIGLIAGTGSIGVGTDAGGALLFAGGWGAVIGDDAGAAGIVREAAKAALGAHDDARPDDGLLAALLASFGVADAERLARVVNDEPTVQNWAPHAPSVFAAAATGSATATGVIEHAADHLALLVGQLVRRGAIGDDVVVAGSVITRQPVLFQALAHRLADHHPSLHLHLLADDPVAGALALAKRLS